MAGGSLGSAYVQVYPVMKGFRKSITSEMKGAGSEGGNALSGALGKAGNRAGAQLGLGLKNSVNTATAGLGGQTLAKLNADVTKASTALSTAQRKAADDAGKVAVAEAKLAEARGKYAAGSSQVISAEERLAAAQRKAAESEATAKTKADALADAENKLKQATAEAAREADNSGSRFGKLGEVLGGVKDKVGGGLHTAMVGIGKAAVAGAATAGAALVGMGTQAVKAYADYEQLAGGVETLFDKGNGAADMVKANADKAFQTAGLSANQYMETVTGFSASLIDSLDGDTVAAAKVADRAVTDMADNANKMGTDIGSIQNAYQGFAKQNYTMLDNLKLGYGGTKEEMQRLIQDAAAMTDEQEKLGVSVDASSMSFDNIANAISVVQSRMGIAGATTEEAELTISGSANAMKGAWANMLTSFGSGENVEGSVNALIDSVITFLGNLVPRVGEVAKNMLSAFGNVIKEKVPALAPAIDGIGAVFGNVSNMLGKVDFGKVFGALAKAGKAVAGPLKSVWTIFKSLVSVVAAFAKAVWPVVQVVGSVLVSAFKAAWSVMSGVLSVVAKVVSAFASMYTKIAGVMGQLYSKVAGVMTSVKNAISTGVNAVIGVVTGIAGRVKAALASAGQWLVQAGKNIIGGLKNGISSMLGSIGSVLGGIGSRVKGALAGAGSWLVGVGSSIVGGLKNGISSMIGGVASLFSGIGGRIKSAMAGAGSWLSSIGSNIVNGLINGIGDFSTRVFNKLKSSVSGGIDKVKGWLGIHSPSRLMAAQVGAPIAEGVALGVEKAAPGTVSAIGDALAGVEQLRYQIPVTATGAVSPVGGMTPNMGVAGGRTVYQTINVQAADPAAVAAVIRAQERVALGA